MKAITIPHTTKLALPALALVFLGWALDAMTGPLWVDFGIHGHFLEMTGTVFFWLGYAVLWILLPIAAFRPIDRFYLRGDCRLRFRKFGIVLGILFVLHFIILCGLIYFFRGGFVGGP